MTIWWLLLILASLGSAGLAFIWLIVHLNRGGPKTVKSRSESVQDAVDRETGHVFNEAFREELRNRGRLNFEKIINDNAMFLQQDLRLTTSQVNDYMKTEMTRTLKEEFDKYEQSITDAKQMAIDSIKKTNAAIDEQRQILSHQLQEEVAGEKKRLLEQFESNMTEIVNHYVIAAVGNQIDLSDQLEYILTELEANKKAIVEDIQNGA